MKLSYFHVADDVPEACSPDVALVIDVLRATTTIAWALHNGADSVQTFTDLTSLKKEAFAWPDNKRILLGERGGKTIEGFDLGNSPLGVTSEIVRGKRLFMSTTNGTRALNRLRNVENLYTLSFPNRSAVGERLLNDESKNVCILGSGWEGSYSLEDSLAAGALASFLVENQSDSVEVINDELNAAIALWQFWKDDIERCLRVATHGKRLGGLGNHDDDFACCAELDKLNIVPTQIEPGVLRAH
tara:strand:- start:973 stop:1704 length:732 start_codon:yes stop_codon:yes gene_type:complete